MKQSHSCGGRFSTEARRSVGGAIERLGLRFLETLPVGPQQPNVILSPVSLAFALAQLTLGQSELSLAYFLWWWAVPDLPARHPPQQHCSGDPGSAGVPKPAKIYKPSEFRSTAELPPIG